MIQSLTKIVTIPTIQSPFHQHLPLDHSHSRHQRVARGTNQSDPRQVSSDRAGGQAGAHLVVAYEGDAVPGSEGGGDEAEEEEGEARRPLEVVGRAQLAPRPRRRRRPATHGRRRHEIAGMLPRRPVLPAVMSPAKSGAAGVWPCLSFSPSMGNGLCTNA